MRHISGRSKNHKLAAAKRWGFFLVSSWLVGFLYLLAMGPITICSGDTTGLSSTTTKTTTAKASPTPQVFAIKEGGDLDLSCPIVVPTEDMIISWTCDNEPANIRSSRIHITESGKLRIKSAKVGDTCNYRCEAADGFGTLSMVIKVIVVDTRFRNFLNRSQFAYPSPQQQQNSLNQQQIVKKSDSRGSLAIESPKNNESSSFRTIDGSLQMPVKSAGQQLQNSQPPPPQSSLEVQVEPESIFVERNRSFSLECKVRYPPYLMEPQIIWLKEFIGPGPDSINEAHEQDLLLIDGVYYHSLNWPRSMSYSRSSSSLNSALLIRQSTAVHSGRYICFAGYPPSIMQSNNNLTFISSSQPPTNTNADSSTRSSLRGGGGGSSHLRPVKYKMALAAVKVGNVIKSNKIEQKQQQLTDPNNNKQTSTLLSSTKNNNDNNNNDNDGVQQKFDWTESNAQTTSEENLLISVFTTNTWIRNLTAALTLLCGLLLALKVVCDRRRRVKRANRAPETAAAESAPADGMENEINNPSETSLSIKHRLRSNSISSNGIIGTSDLYHSKQPHKPNLIGSLSNSIRGSETQSSDSQHILLETRRHLEGTLATNSLESATIGNTSNGLMDTDLDKKNDTDSHLYSEIEVYSKLIREPRKEIDIENNQSNS